MKRDLREVYFGDPEGEDREATEQIEAEHGMERGFLRDRYVRERLEPQIEYWIEQNQVQPGSEGEMLVSIGVLRGLKMVKSLIASVRKRHEES